MNIHLFHKWGKWEEESRATLRTSPQFGPNAGNWHSVGFVVVQKRVCAICGFTERARDEIKGD